MPFSSIFGSNIHFIFLSSCHLFHTSAHTIFTLQTHRISTINLPSTSTSLIMSCNSCSVGFCPSDRMTVPNSFVVIVPSPSLSKREKASRNSVTKEMASQDAWKLLERQKHFRPYQRHQTRMIPCTGKFFPVCFCFPTASICVKKQNWRYFCWLDCVAVWEDSQRVERNTIETEYIGRWSVFAFRSLKRTKWTILCSNNERKFQLFYKGTQAEAPYLSRGAVQCTFLLDQCPPANPFLLFAIISQKCLCFAQKFCMLPGPNEHQNVHLWEDRSRATLDRGTKGVQHLGRGGKVSMHGVCLMFSHQGSLSTWTSPTNQKQLTI